MTLPLRVLLVEDSDSDAKLILLALRAGGRVIEHTRVEDPPSMRAALEDAWDVVICDWSMPHFSAMAALRLLREAGRDTPFIIASGTIGEELAVEAMRMGAHDYVLKDRLTRLLPAIEREIREANTRAARRTAEEEVQAQATRFRALIEHSTDAIVLADAAGCLLYASPSITRMLGFAPEDLIGRTVLELIHPDDRTEFASFIASLQAGRVSADLEARALHRDGTPRWIEGSVTNMLGNPAVRAVIGNFRDVTERKRARDDLRLSETRFRRLSESGIIAIVFADLQGNIFEANDAYLEMFGYTRDELLAGKVLWAEMTPPEWKAVDDAALDLLRSRGVAPPWEKELFHKDGHRVPVVLGVAMLDDVTCITFLADMTERRRAEEALTDIENQLRQAQKMEAIGQLAGGVAHDFNNILSVILSYSFVIDEGLKPNDPVREDIGEICKAAGRAAELTRQLLMFSRQQVIEPRVLDLNKVIVSLEKMLQRILGEDVEIALVSEPSLGHVRADLSCVEQVIMNLVVNARDAMPTGGKLTIETANVTLDESYARTHADIKPGAYVMLGVTDTGVGMDKATQARVFEPFFTTKEVGKGTGLGLSTVFGIVQQSGGSIWIYSELGHGTTFKIYFPRSDMALEAVRTTEIPTTLRGNETILLVEDDDQLRVVAHGILQRNGYKVIEARGGGDALLACERYADPIQLLLTDVVMPQISGPALAKRLVALKPEMKVLCMSGYTDDSIVRHGVLQAELAFLQKPFTPESLTRKVREVLDKASRA